MKYIEADKLSEKLKHYLDIQPATDGLPGKYSYETRGVKQAIDYALSLIKDFQQEQSGMDLEKDIDAFFDKWDKNSNGSIFDENGAPVTIKTIKGVVKHFLNAKKEVI